MSLHQQPADTANLKQDEAPIAPQALVQSDEGAAALSREELITLENSEDAQAQHIQQDHKAPFADNIEESQYALNGNEASVDLKEEVPPPADVEEAAHTADVNNSAIEAEATEEQLQHFEGEMSGNAESEEAGHVQVVEPLSEGEKERALKEMTDLYESSVPIRVSGLPEDINEEELRQLLSQFGEVHCVSVVEPRREHAIVRMTYSGAAKAKEALDKTTIRGKEISLEDVQLDAMLFMGNLSDDIGVKDLRALVEPYGRIERAFLMRSPTTGRNKGYGFVELAAKNQASAAKAALSSCTFRNRTIRVDWSHLSKLEDMHSPLLFVDRLPLNIADQKDQLKQLFESCGVVKAINIPSNPLTGTPRGFAFILFETAEQAEKARDTLHNATLQGAHIRVSFGNPSKPEIANTSQHRYLPGPSPYRQMLYPGRPGLLPYDPRQVFLQQNALAALQYGGRGRGMLPYPMMQIPAMGMMGRGRGFPYGYPSSPMARQMPSHMAGRGGVNYYGGILPTPSGASQSDAYSPALITPSQATGVSVSSVTERNDQSLLGRIQQAQAQVLSRSQQSAAYGHAQNLNASNAYGQPAPYSQSITTEASGQATSAAYTNPNPYAQYYAQMQSQGYPSYQYPQAQAQLQAQAAQINLIQQTQQPAATIYGQQEANAYAQNTVSGYSQQAVSNYGQQVSVYEQPTSGYDQQAAYGQQATTYAQPDASGYSQPSAYAQQTATQNSYGSYSYNYDYSTYQNQFATQTQQQYQPAVQQATAAPVVSIPSITSQTHSYYSAMSAAAGQKRPYAEMDQQQQQAAFYGGYGAYGSDPTATKRPHY